ncbi:MAG TPA: hypothetical protein VGB82_23555 [Alphaproteobacteria bacterium]
MIKRVVLTLGIAVALATSAFAAEMPNKKPEFGGQPKGSYSVSCTCAMSAGIDLMCYCNNLQAKMFRTSLDIRKCPLPKDIKNCNGALTCTESQSARCPEQN